MKFKNNIQTPEAEFNQSETMTFSSLDIDYLKNALNEIGKPVPENFEYRSDNNEHFLSIKEIIDINKSLD